MRRQESTEAWPRLRRRPRQARSEASVSAILEATTQILEQEPSPSTNRIAERAGVSIGTLYQYFPNRTAILALLAERERARVLARLNAVLAEQSAAPLEDVVRRLLRVVLGAFGQRAGLRRRLLLALLPRAAEWAGAAAAPAPAPLEEIMAALQARFPRQMRGLSALEVYVLSRAVMGMLRTALVEGPPAAPALDDPALEDALLRLVLGFLAVAPSGHHGGEQRVQP